MKRYLFAKTIGMGKVLYASSCILFLEHFPIVIIFFVIFLFFLVLSFLLAITFPKWFCAHHASADKRFLYMYRLAVVKLLILTFHKAIHLYFFTYLPWIKPIFSSKELLVHPYFLQRFYWLIFTWIIILKIQGCFCLSLEFGNPDGHEESGFSVIFIDLRKLRMALIENHYFIQTS